MIRDKETQEKAVIANGWYELSLIRNIIGNAKGVKIVLSTKCAVLFDFFIDWKSTLKAENVSITIADACSYKAVHPKCAIFVG